MTHATPELLPTRVATPLSRPLTCTGWLLALVLALASLPATGQLVINEIVANNKNTIDDVDGESSDWIEIRNPTAGHLLWIPGAPEPPRDFATLMGAPGLGRLVE